MEQQITQQSADQAEVSEETLPQQPVIASDNSPMNEKQIKQAAIMGSFEEVVVQQEPDKAPTEVNNSDVSSAKLCSEKALDPVPCDENPRKEDGSSLPKTSQEEIVQVSEGDASQVPISMESKDSIEEESKEREEIMNIQPKKVVIGVCGQESCSSTSSEEEKEIERANQNFESQKNKPLNEETQDRLPDKIQSHQVQITGSQSDSSEVSSTSSSGQELDDEDIHDQQEAQLLQSTLEDGVEERIQKSSSDSQSIETQQVHKLTSVEQASTSKQEESEETSKKQTEEEIESDPKVQKEVPQQKNHIVGIVEGIDQIQDESKQEVPQVIQQPEQIVLDTKDKPAIQEEEQKTQPMSQVVQLQNADQVQQLQIDQSQQNPVQTVPTAPSTEISHQEDEDEDEDEDDENDDDDGQSQSQSSFVVEISPRGRFKRFGEELGRGAYKIVYRGVDNETGCEIAWNVINVNRLPKQDRVRIKSEIDLIKKLEHKNIIHFISAWYNKEKEQVVFITEMITGGSLRKYVKRIKTPRLKVIKGWCKEILQGLVYLHEQKPHPIIHRDLKCDNIFINSNSGEIRIGDLGLSTPMQNSFTTSVLGTPEFMAPELYEECYGTGVDIYAFGMCVLEMITLERPYIECQNPAQIYNKVIHGIRPMALDRIKDEEIKEFVSQCLIQEEQRPSAKDLLNSKFLNESESEKNHHEVLVTRALVKNKKNSSQMGNNATGGDISAGVVEVQQIKKKKQSTILEEEEEDNQSETNHTRIQQKPLPQTDATSTIVKTDLTSDNKDDGSKNEPTSESQNQETQPTEKQSDVQEQINITNPSVVKEEPDKPNFQEELSQNQNLSNGGLQQVLNDTNTASHEFTFVQKAANQNSSSQSSSGGGPAHSIIQNQGGLPNISQKKSSNKRRQKRKGWKRRLNESVHFLSKIDEEKQKKLQEKTMNQRWNEQQDRQGSHDLAGLPSGNILDELKQQDKEEEKIVAGNSSLKVPQQNQQVFNYDSSDMNFAANIKKDNSAKGDHDYENQKKQFDIKKKFKEDQQKSSNTPGGGQTNLVKNGNGSTANKSSKQSLPQAISSKKSQFSQETQPNKASISSQSGHPDDLKRNNSSIGGQALLDTYQASLQINKNSHQHTPNNQNGHDKKTVHHQQSETIQQYAPIQSTQGVTKNQKNHGGQFSQHSMGTHHPQNNLESNFDLQITSSDNISDSACQGENEAGASEAENGQSLVSNQNIQVNLMLSKIAFSASGIHHQGDDQLKSYDPLTPQGQSNHQQPLGMPKIVHSVTQTFQNEQRGKTASIPPTQSRQQPAAASYSNQQQIMAAANAASPDFNHKINGASAPSAPLQRTNTQASQQQQQIKQSAPQNIPMKGGDSKVQSQLPSQKTGPNNADTNHQKQTTVSVSQPQLLGSSTTSKPSITRKDDSQSQPSSQNKGNTNGAPINVSQQQIQQRQSNGIEQSNLYRNKKVNMNFKIADKDVTFDFDTTTDTPEGVAQEMVKELQLNESQIDVISKQIQAAIYKNSKPSFQQQTQVHGGYTSSQGPDRPPSGVGTPQQSATPLNVHGKQAAGPPQQQSISQPQTAKQISLASQPTQIQSQIQQQQQSTLPPQQATSIAQKRPSPSKLSKDNAISMFNKLLQDIEQFYVSMQNIGISNTEEIVDAMECSQEEKSIRMNFFNKILVAKREYKSSMEQYRVKKQKLLQQQQQQQQLLQFNPNQQNQEQTMNHQQLEFSAKSVAPRGAQAGTSSILHEEQKPAQPKAMITYNIPSYIKNQFKSSPAQFQCYLKLNKNLKRREDISKSDDPSISAGNDPQTLPDEEVMQLQHILNLLWYDSLIHHSKMANSKEEAAQMIQNHHPLKVDGFFDEKTEKCVIKFQKYKDLPKNGVVTDIIWSLMLAHVEQIVSGDNKSKQQQSEVTQAKSAAAQILQTSSSQKDSRQGVPTVSPSTQTVVPQQQPSSNNQSKAPMKEAPKQPLINSKQSQQPPRISTDSKDVPNPTSPHKTAVKTSTHHPQSNPGLFQQETDYKSMFELHFANPQTSQQNGNQIEGGGLQYSSSNDMDNQPLSKKQDERTAAAPEDH